MADVRSSPSYEVPNHIRNAPTQLMKDMDYGKGYKYSHDGAGNFLEQEYLPEELSESKYYSPSKNVQEEKSRERLKVFWKEKYGY